MDAILAITVLTAAILAATALAALILVTAAIHSEERHLSLSAQPATPAQALARKILAVRVSQAAARRIFAARHAHTAGQAAPQRRSPPHRPAPACAARPVPPPPRRRRPCGQERAHGKHEDHQPGPATSPKPSHKALGDRHDHHSGAALPTASPRH